MSARALSRLRARVRLDQPQTTPDEMGGGAVSWVSAGEVWAAIEGVSASDAPAYDGRVSRARYRVDIRDRADVRAGWRVVWETRALGVRGVVLDEARALLTLHCEEEQS